jgi:hypothetical protein
MASSDKKRKSKQSHHKGSGWARARRAKASIRRVKLKINRWKRYAKEVAANTRPAPVDPTRWDTEGLERHLNTLEGIVKKGRTD